MGKTKLFTFGISVCLFTKYLCTSYTHILTTTKTNFKCSFCFCFVFFLFSSRVSQRDRHGNVIIIKTTQKTQKRGINCPIAKLDKKTFVCNNLLSVCSCLAFRGFFLEENFIWKHNYYNFTQVLEIFWKICSLIGGRQPWWTCTMHCKRCICWNISFLITNDWNEKQIYENKNLIFSLPSRHFIWQQESNISACFGTQICQKILLRENLRLKLRTEISESRNINTSIWQDLVHPN